MDFYSWYYNSNSSAVVTDAKEQTLEEHDRRFHPDGYKDGDVCTLRDTAKEQDFLSIESSHYGKAVELLKNWLPNITIVENNSSDALENALTDDVRKYIKTRCWKDWKQFVQDYLNGVLTRSAGGTKTTYDILDYVPNVIAGCFVRLGYKDIHFASGKIETDLRAISKTIDKSSGIRSKKPDGPTAFQNVLKRLGPSEAPYVPTAPGLYLKSDDYRKKTVVNKITGRTSEKIPHFHGVPLEAWETIPLTLDKPIAIFRSATEPRGLTIITKYEDDDNGNDDGSNSKILKTPNGQIVYSDKEKKNPRHQYACMVCYGPGIDEQGRSDGIIRVASFYGKSQKEFKDDLKNGLLMYVDTDQIKEVEDQFGDLNLGAVKTQNPTPDIINKLSHASGYMPEIRPSKHKVLTQADFSLDFLGEIMEVQDEDLMIARRSGNWDKMRKVLDDYARGRGFSYDVKTDKYMDGKGNAVSAELQEWDGNGNSLTLEQRFSIPNNSDRRFRIIRKGNEPVGWYNRTTGEVHLVKGKADVETVVHELGWHASFHSAEKNNPKLYNKMKEYAKNAPTGIKDAVLSIYGNELTEDELLDEIGAHRFTEDHLDVINDEIAKREAIGWFGKVKDGMKRIWSGFISRIGGNRFDSSKIQDLTPEDGMRILAKAMVAGKTLDVSSLGEKRTE